MVDGDDILIGGNKDAHISGPMRDVDGTSYGLPGGAAERPAEPLDADARNALVHGFHDKWHGTKPSERKDIVREVVNYVAAHLRAASQVGEPREPPAPDTEALAESVWREFNSYWPYERNEHLRQSIMDAVRRASTNLPDLKDLVSRHFQQKGLDSTVAEIIQVLQAGIPGLAWKGPATPVDFAVRAGAPPTLTRDIQLARTIEALVNVAKDESRAEAFQRVSDFFAETAETKPTWTAKEASEQWAMYAASTRALSGEGPPPTSEGT